MACWVHCPPTFAAKHIFSPHFSPRARPLEFVPWGGGGRADLGGVLVVHHGGQVVDVDGRMGVPQARHGGQQAGLPGWPSGMRAEGNQFGILFEFELNLN